MGSRGSIIPYFLSLSDTKSLPITDKQMTRFMITLEQGVQLVWKAFEDMVGGEIYVKKIPSMKVIDIANTINSSAKLNIIGIRPGEKLHEEMVSNDDANFTYEYDEYYKILPAINDWHLDKVRIKKGKKVSKDFSYTSKNNNDWMTKEELKNWIEKNKNSIGSM